MYNDELQHHGVQGMKWGIRRTEAQLSRDKKVAEGAYNASRHITNLTGQARQLKTVKEQNRATEMDDNELKQVISRLQMEQQYKQLTASKTNEGQDRVRNTMEIAGSVLAVTTSAITIALAIKEFKSGKKG